MVFKSCISFLPEADHYLIWCPCTWGRYGGFSYAPAGHSLWAPATWAHRGAWSPTGKILRCQCVALPGVRLT